MPRSLCGAWWFQSFSKRINPMGFSIYYRSVSPVPADSRKTVESKCMELCNARSWLSYEPVSFFPANSDEANGHLHEAPPCTQQTRAPLSIEKQHPVHSWFLFIAPTCGLLFCKRDHKQVQSTMKSPGIVWYSFSISNWVKRC